MYVVTALLQGSLLTMGIYFEYLGPKKDIINGPINATDETVEQSSSPPGEEEPPSENTPLLQS